jgi:dihydroneopterin aldolase
MSIRLPSTPPDRLAVHGIEAFGRHGVLEEERREGQVFGVDLVLGLDTATAAASDALGDTVDYAGLVSSVVAAVENDPVDLIETLAERIAALCLVDRRVAWTEVTVHKPHAPIDATFADVTVTIHRSRS